MNVEKEAKRIISEVGDPAINKQRIIEILDEHQDCFGADFCDVCEYIDEEVLDGILENLASNPGLDAELQDRVYDEARKWQGQEVAVLVELAGNPSLSDKLKAYLLGPEMWFGMDEGEEIIGLFIENAKKNPRFTKSEVDEFLKTCKEEFDYE